MNIVTQVIIILRLDALFDFFNPEGNLMKNSLLLACSLTLITTSSVLMAEGNQTAGKEKAASCVGCHGEDGNSLVSSFPKLAGQHASYLVKQLQAFKSESRKDPMMSSIAASLSDQDMHDIANYYAANKIQPNSMPEIDKDADANEQAQAKEAQEKLLAEGRNVYRNGNLSTQVSACIACHGPFGDGNKPASFPVLKAQHADYLVKTLTDFKTSQRSNNPDNMMHMIALKMSDQEIKAVATYLSLQK